MTVVEQTRRILLTDREARNVDKHFEIVFMQERGMELTPKQIEVFKNMPDLWTARRIKQQLQSEDKGEEKYRADAVVRKARRHKAHVMQQNAPKAKPERVEKLIEQKAQIPLFNAPTQRSYF